MTAQASERLIYGGKDTRLCSNPLSLYLKQTGIKFESPSTACWRGYIGTWEIIESAGVGRLYLVELSAHRTYEEIVGVSDIFLGFDRVFAHWFTGELRCPQGALLDYVHGGYSSTYEYDLFLEIKKGLVINRRAVHNKARS